MPYRSGVHLPPVLPLPAVPAGGEPPLATEPSPGFGRGPGAAGSSGESDPGRDDGSASPGGARPFFPTATTGGIVRSGTVAARLLFLEGSAGRVTPGAGPGS